MLVDAGKVPTQPTSANGSGGHPDHRCPRSASPPGSGHIAASQRTAGVGHIQTSAKQSPALGRGSFAASYALRLPLLPFRFRRHPAEPAAANQHRAGQAGIDDGAGDSSEAKGNRRSGAATAERRCGACGDVLSGGCYGTSTRYPLTL
jgi:hypothetical protein